MNLAFGRDPKYGPGMPKKVAGHAVAVLATLLVACATRAPAAPAAAPQPASPTDEGGGWADDDADPAADDASGEDETIAEAADAEPCPTNMVLVASGETRFCVDKFEASLVEIDEGGSEKPFPHYLPVDGHRVRAVSQPDVFPQAFISEIQAEDACAASGKRLCTHVEWKTACMGPSRTTFPYGNARQAGVCHDGGKSAVAAVFGFQRLADPVAAPAPTARAVAATKATAGKSTRRQPHVTAKRAAESSRPRPTPAARATAAASSATPRKKKAAKTARVTAATSKAPHARASSRPASVEPSVWSQLNDPRLGQVDGALARTGSHEACVNGYGAVDMVGNLHEWVRTDRSAPHGTFAGGYYLDTAINGDGCNYRTTAHAHDYHDYSTGFRCCAEAKP